MISPRHFRFERLFGVVGLVLAFARAQSASTEFSPLQSNGPVVISVALLDSLSEVLNTNHPALRAARARTAAAGHDVASVRTWQDPEARLSGSVATRRGPDPSEEGDIIYGVDQKLPLFGRPRAARAVAQAEAAMETQKAEALFQTLRRDLSRALFDVALADRAIALVEEDLRWLDTTLGVIEARLRAGTASQFDMLRLQNERSRLATEVVTEHRRRDDARVTLNRLLGLAPDVPVSVLTLPAVAEPIAFTQALVHFATNTEPRLLLAEREIRTASARMEATRLSRLPEVMVGVQGRQFHGDGGIRDGMFTVGLSLPWFNAPKYRRDLAREQERHVAAQHERQNLILEVVNEVHHRTVAIDAARREALLYRDEILPRSEQALQVATAGWSSGRMELRDVLEGRRMLIEARRTLARAVAMQWSEMSDLVLCCGLSDIEMLQQLGRPDQRP